MRGALLILRRRLAFVFFGLYSFNICYHSPPPRHAVAARPPIRSSRTRTSSLDLRRFRIRDQNWISSSSSHTEGELAVFLRLRYQCAESFITLTSFSSLHFSLTREIGIPLNNVPNGKADDRPTAMKVLLYLIRERGREIRVEVVTEDDLTSFVIQMQEEWRGEE